MMTSIRDYGLKQFAQADLLCEKLASVLDAIIRPHCDLDPLEKFLQQANTDIQNGLYDRQVPECQKFNYDQYRATLRVGDTDISV